MDVVPILLRLALAAATPLVPARGVAPDEAIGRALERLAYGEVQRRIDELERAAPGSVEATYWTGRLALERCGDGPAALAAAQACLRAEPHRPEYLVLEGDGIGLAAAREGMWKAFRKADDVLERYEKALEIDPANPTALQRLVQYHLIVPRVFGGGVDKAEAFAERLRKVDAYRGSLAAASVARKRKDDRAVERSLRAAVDAEPIGARARGYLADMLRRQKRLDDAEIEARAAIRADPAAAYGWLALANVQRAREGQHDAALATLADAHRATGGHPLVHFELLGLRLEADGTDGLAEAAERLDAVVRNEPPSCWSAVPANRLLGDAYERLGRRDDAERCYRACLAADPDDAKAKKGLKRLSAGG